MTGSSRAKKKKSRSAIVFALPLCIVVTSIMIAGPLGKSYGNIPLIFAGAAMPEGSVNMIKSELAGNTQTQMHPAITESQTPQEQEAQDAVKTSDRRILNYDQTATPADIVSLIEQAKVQQEKASKSGSIKEKTFGKKDASDVYENVHVKNVTKNGKSNIKANLGKKADLKITDKSQPSVLIFHTHTTESYEILDRGFYSSSFPTRSSSASNNMVRVGVAITDRLEAAGFKVIHDTHIHDTTYNGSYARSRKCIEEYKKKYPSLQVIIDVHRDGIKQSDGTKIKPMAEIDGKKAAQIMIITGCEEGKVESFPNWEKNLVFALQLQKAAQDMYPGLMKPVYFSPRKYNMDTSNCSVLLEMGSDANTLAEAVYSGELVGNALAILMDRYVV